MKLSDEADVLRKVPLFAKLEPARLKLLAFTSERMTFQPGQVMCKQGDNGDAAFVVIDGSADVLLETPKGEVTVARLGAHEVIGEIAILCDIPRTATVRAVERVETLRIDKEQFMRLMREFPDIAIEVMRELADRLSRTTYELSQARNALKAAQS